MLGSVRKNAGNGLQAAGTDEPGNTQGIELKQVV